MAGTDFDIIIVGGGAGGIATAASILKRSRDYRIAIVEPAKTHYYQPGWTVVGRGLWDPRVTARPMASVMPRGVEWIRTAAKAFEPEQNTVVLDDGSRLAYRLLVVAAGIKLDWGQIAGLEATLGKNGVTSNYRYDLAPYTWELVTTLNSGRAIFTQPPMPIKCAGAPQKAMYLSCDAWRRRGVLDNIDVEFRNAGAVLFGVEVYVPALMEYVDRYGIDLNLGSKLVAVDGAAKLATFETAAGPVIREFDMIHVVPPQVAPDFVRHSPLANEAGWVEVDDLTLRHKRYPNVFAVGDVGSMPNAKTAAAVRKQAPVAAVNALAVLAGGEPVAAYDGYGSCPLTVEAGEIVLAEFGYGGKLLPTFPTWLVDGTRPRWLSWLLKIRVLPWIYWHAMLRGREWLARPTNPLPPKATAA